jgi:hypothetical protein
MSPEVRNASPRLMRVAISASEYWRPAEECTTEDGAPVGKFSGTDVLTGGGVVAKDVLSPRLGPSAAAGPSIALH